MSDVSWNRISDLLREVEEQEIKAAEAAVREAIHAAHDRLRQRLTVVAMGGEEEE